MNSHLRKDLERLKLQIMKVAIGVEENVRRSVEALRELSVKKAEEVIEADLEIDKLEVDTEEECLKILALHQPVASDLRFVITVLKINNELEHIGDMAANIAKRVIFLRDAPPAKIPFDIEKMSKQTLSMLKSAIDAFVRYDELKAIKVCEDDEDVDDENRQCYANVKSIIGANPDCAMAQINYLLVSKSFERIADLCTNIAEDIIYMKHSVIIRHNLKNAEQKLSGSSLEEAGDWD